jgi:hypothetical protein
MSGERAIPATAAPMPSDPSGRDRGRTLSGLIDVLDRADAGRPQARRPAAHRPAGSRSRAVGTVPLRSVQPAPMARPAPTPRAYVLPEPEPAPIGRLSDVVRRAAMWGAGPQGEYLAWPAAPRPATPPARRPARLRALVRRLTMWGAGPHGEYLAWGRRPVPGRRRDVDPPVVLREMPSTPTIQPAAPSPAVALLPRVPASSAGRSSGVSHPPPPVPRGAVAVPGIRPGGPPERSRATGRPSHHRPSPQATGLVRARGDPLSCPARGSPAPARRSRSPGSARSSFP